MPYSYVVYTGNGSTTQFAITFPYIRKEHVKVYVNYVDTAYTYVNDTTVQLAAAPASPLRVEVRRVTPLSTRLVDYTDGSTLVAADLDTSNLQSLYNEQELDDNQKRGIFVDDATGLITAGGQRITSVANPVNAQDAATKTYVDTADALKVAKAGDSMTGALAMGTNKITGLGNPTSAQDAATKTYVDTADALKVAKAGDTMSGALAMGSNKITGLGTPTANADAATKLYVDTVTLAGNVPDGDRGDITVSGVGTSWAIDAGAVVEAKLGTGAVTETKLGTGAVVEAKLGTGAVTETKLGTGAVTSTKILDGTILNADVNATAGIVASKLSFTQAGASAVARTVESKLKDTVSVKDFGAKGDNSTDDTAAIQAAINAVEGVYRGTVIFPQGLYRISASIQLPSFLTLCGETESGCHITNQGSPLNVPHVVNKSPDALIFAKIKNLGFLFGTYGIKIDVTAEVAGLRFENVFFFSHSVASFYCNKLLQTSSFYNCNFDLSQYGVQVPAFTSNANTFVNCGFLNNTEACVDLYISEVNNFISCRFEGGGVVGKPTIRVYQAKALNFTGCYFEATNSILLQETGSFNSVSFEGNHFTGAGGGPGWNPYTFSSDGIVLFGSNRWGEVPSNGPAKMLITGINNSVADPARMLGSKDSLTYLTATRSAYNIISPVVACPNLTRNLISVEKLFTDGNLTNINMLTGILTTNLYALEIGGFPSVHTGIYRLAFVSVGSTLISAFITTINTTTLAGAVTATLSSTATQTSSTVAITFAGVAPATQISSAFQWSFECLNTGTTRNDIMIPVIA